MPTRITAEDVLTQKQLEAIAIQAEGIGSLASARRLNVSTRALKQRRQRARLILDSLGITPPRPTLARRKPPSPPLPQA